MLVVSTLTLRISLLAATTEQTTVTVASEPEEATELPIMPLLPPNDGK